MIGKRFRSLPFIFANDNYTLSQQVHFGILPNLLYELSLEYISVLFISSYVLMQAIELALFNILL